MAAAITDRDPSIGDPIPASVGTFERPDGSTQVSANGWPLDYYEGDVEPGEATGQGVGDVWWVLDPSGFPITDQPGTATPAPTPRPSKGGSTGSGTD